VKLLARVAIIAVASAGLTLAGTSVANAAANPSGTGQPSASCEDSATSHTPGNSASAPGSAFNPDGNAGTHYAGEQPQNSNNPHSVSQYDVACYQTSQSH
jgi:hypothetical protein